MKSLLVQVDDQTLTALNRIAPPGKRRRAEFIREAIRSAIRQANNEAIREAYRKQPDSAEEADDWTTAEEYRP